MLIPALLVAGPLADAVGHRTVLLPAVAVAALGSLIFALADGGGMAVRRPYPAGPRGRNGLGTVDGRAVAGVGQGLAFLGGLTAVNQAAPADRRAGVLSGFYVIIYLGVGVPVIGVGFLATVAGLLAAVQYFACGIAALCLVVLLVLARAHRRADRRLIDRRSEILTGPPPFRTLVGSVLRARSSAIRCG